MKNLIRWAVALIMTTMSFCLVPGLSGDQGTGIGSSTGTSGPAIPAVNDAEQLLLQATSAEINQAKERGKHETDVNTKGYKLKDVSAAMKELEKQHYYVDFYAPHDLYVAWRNS